MKITNEVMRTLWYEDSEGNFLAEPDYTNGPLSPEGAKYQVSQFPNQLVTTCLRADTDKSEEVYQATSSYPNDLATAMARFHDFDVRTAIMVCAQACERCLNVLCHEYLSNTPLGSEEGDGYAEGSEQWIKSRTECLMCRHLDETGEGVFVEIERSRRASG